MTAGNRLITKALLLVHKSPLFQALNYTSALLPLHIHFAQMMPRIYATSRN